MAGTAGPGATPMGLELDYQSLNWGEIIRLARPQNFDYWGGGRRNNYFYQHFREVDLNITLPPNKYFESTPLASGQSLKADSVRVDWSSQS